MNSEQRQPKDWRRIEGLYHAALERNSNEREMFLANACAGDSSLQGAVWSLLSHDAHAGGLLETPALEVVLRWQAEEQARIVGSFVGGYRILRKLGEGGMGVVYEAEQQQPRRLVALKVIRGGRLVDEYQLRLFQREVRALARLRHPGIAAIHESGCTEDGRHFFAMELVRGVPLLDFVKGRRLDGAQSPSGIRQRLELFLEICNAIAYAHQRGVIHRDLKPANILVSEEPNARGPEVKVLDFGLARITDEDGLGASDVSGVGLIKGTFSYMSPEQARGDAGAIDVRTDVYTLGVILYELLTERLPHEFDPFTLPQAVRIICEESPTPPGRIGGAMRSGPAGWMRRLDRDVETIALKALEKDPERRYQSVAALAEDVTRYLGDRPIRARPPGAFYQFRKLAARHKAAFALLAALFTLLLAFAAAMTVQSARIARERDKALAAERGAAEQRDAAEQARHAVRRQRDAAERARGDEQAQRLLAEANLEQAGEQRRRAETQELTNRRLLYVARMNLTWQDWETINLSRLRDTLEEARPQPGQPGQEDLRGFEWYYYWRLLHRDRLTLPHASAILSIAVSPDGTRLAAAGYDGVVTLWDLASRRRLTTFRGHAKAVRSVAFSPDGMRLATGGADFNARLWDVATGRELALLTGHTGMICSVAFSPDGRLLATASWDRQVKLWDVASGREVKSLRGHAGWVWSAAFAPDGRTLATASEDRTVKLWSVESASELATFRGHTASVYTVAFSPDGARLATGGNDRTVKIWAVASARELATLASHALDVNTVTFSPDGARLASASQDRLVRLWDAANWKELATFKGHAEEVWSVAFSPEGASLFTGSEDYTVKRWDIADGMTERARDTFERHFEEVRDLAFSPDGTRFATASSFTVKVWEVATGRQLGAFTAPQNIHSVAWSPDGRRLAAGSSGGNAITVWDAATDRKLTLKGHTDWVYSVSFSPDGRQLASASRDQTVRLWDLAANRESHVLRAHTSGVRSVVFSPDGTRLATGSFDNTLRLWDPVAARELVTLKGHVGQVNSIAFSPDGERLASGSSDRTIKLWDAGTAREIATLRGHAAIVWSVAFSPDGRRLASGGNDRRVKLWDLVTRQELITLDAHAGPVYVVKFAPDGRTLASGSRDWTAKLWRTATEQEILARVTY